jgi:NAD(P)-dependent dehydrogenase (short-subunit alcohol dehydrogenase family)
MQQVVLVTAGTSGLGQAICRMAGAAGYDVAINYRNSSATAEKLADEIRATGAKALTIRADVTQDAEVVAMFNRIDTELGPITALVNNAGGGLIVLGPGGCRAVDATAKQIHDILAFNVASMMLCTREALRRMSTARGGAGGAIVNISSDCSRLGGTSMRRGGATGLVLYAAAKSAVDGYTMNVATEVAEEGVRINAVRPAAIRTPAPKNYERAAVTIPMARPAAPEEIGEVVMFLLSDKASFMTGALVDATGGR